ncbi:hypothetical protein AMTR_s00049p00216010 [Amborella trichopoda]|uniref:Uncharacterized protein n=1 Tax=Amborella trichopoda TaxID=13333 RepID=W1PZJ8_AMBTC|nr:hypothetical protein AMTR_s00049p00216010 [Amborella trichopoda]
MIIEWFLGHKVFISRAFIDSLEGRNPAREPSRNKRPGLQVVAVAEAKIRLLDNRMEIGSFTRDEEGALNVDIPKVTNKPGPLSIPNRTQEVGGTPTLNRQGSGKMNCLCSPTTHAGSFRCRHHRNPTPLQRTKSDGASSLHDQTPKSIQSIVDSQC